MAQQFVTGPCDIFVNYGSLGGVVTPPLFLGHSERGPRMQVRPQYSSSYVDIGGQKIPFDSVYDGQDAIVSADLSRWDETVYAAISIKSGASANNAPAGTDDPGDIGTLMIHEGAAIQVWLRFPHAAKLAYSTMPAGYRFPVCMLQNDDHNELGTKPRKISLVFHCLREFDVSVTNAFGAGRFVLFDHDMSGLPPIN